jgi:hypothetical protein
MEKKKKNQTTPIKILKQKIKKKSIAVDSKITIIKN